jgi:hypothetical protein
MPYVQGANAHGVVHVADVYNSPNVYANNTLIALWNAAGGTGGYSFNAIIPSVEITELEVAYVNEQLDADGVDDFSTSSYAAQQISQSVSVGVSSGAMTSATTATTTVGIADTTPAPVSTGTVITADWNQFNQDNIPYDTLMLTPKTSLATFTKKTGLWTTQPTPLGPNAVQPAGGDNKHLKEQDLFRKGQKVGRITVPQLLHNLSNLAANVWEPIKARYPGAIVTNTFRQSPPGGKSQQAQHGAGMAMDIQIPGFGPQEYLDACIWIRDNLPFDQLLQEKAGNTRWIHVSHYSGYGYKTAEASRVANMVVSPSPAFTPGLALMA